MKKSRRKTKKVSFMLDGETLNKLKAVCKLSNQSISTVVSVIIALRVISEKGIRK